MQVGGEGLRLGFDILRWLINRCFAVVDGRGVRHGLKLRLACLVCFTKSMLGAEYKSALSDFEVKSTVYKQRQSRSVRKGCPSFFLLLLLVVVNLSFFFFEVKSIVLNWLPGQTFV